MEIAGGSLGWSEAEFWDCSYQYFIASVTGWMEVNGGPKSDDVSEAEYEKTKEENAGWLNMTPDEWRAHGAKNRVKA